MPPAKALDKKRLWRQIDREERAKARAKLLALRTQLRETKGRRKQALVDARERCRAERLAARERARAIRIRVLEELREAMRAERFAARQTCTVRLGEARGIKNDIARARAEVLAERAYQRDLRAIERSNRKRRLEAPRIARVERHGESDDEVRSNVPADLHPLFEKVKKGIKSTPRMTRTEAFLLWAEQHPRDVVAALEDKTEAVIRELEAQHREAHRSLRRRAAPPRAPRYSPEELAAVPF